MWKMRLIKSIELYRTGEDRPWRIALLVKSDGCQIIELNSPKADTDKVRLQAVTNADYNLMLDLMTRAVNPDEIHQQIQRGWE